MSQAPFVPFYTSDFLGGTSGMTAATKGVYITLLCLMYEAEAPLPQSWETLARRCGCTLPAFRRAVESLEDDGKIVTTEGGLWSPKCDKHIAQRRERQSSATAAAKTRWGKAKEKQCGTDAPASSAQCQPEPEPEPYKAGAGAPSVGARKRGTRLPADWALPDDWRDWAVSEHGMTADAARFEADKFRDYWHAKAGRDACKLDWLATWRNWCRTAAARRPTQPATITQFPRIRAKLPEGWQ
jgi:uncharacterized protein YdaU (DUF1376 family)